MPTRRSRGIRSYGQWRIDERVILLSPRWCKPSVPDQALHLLGRCAVSGVGSGDDILLDHQRAEVVASEPQRYLTYLHSHRHPARLKIGYIVQYDARERDRAEILGGAGLWLARHRRSVLRLERPAYECRESARASLHLLHPLKMFQPLGKRFAQAIHHRDGRLHPFPVRQLHDLQPPVGTGLLRCDDIPNALYENLSSSAGNRIESSLPQFANHFDRFHAEQLGEEIDLARTESVDVDRVVALDVTH